MSILSLLVLCFSGLAPISLFSSTANAANYFASGAGRSWTAYGQAVGGGNIVAGQPMEIVVVLQWDAPMHMYRYNSGNSGAYTTIGNTANPRVPTMYYTADGANPWNALSDNVSAAENSGLSYFTLSSDFKTATWYFKATAPATLSGKNIQAYSRGSTFWTDSYNFSYTDAFTMTSTPPGALAAPTISSAAITGTANIGQTLTASLSLGGGTPSSTTYQWSSSDSASGTYSNISGATSGTYVVPTAQVGKFIKFTATVSNSSGSASATSSATSRVNDGLFLRYDAGNSSSYSGSGTTVNDISGAGIGGTLTGGSSTYPGFVSTYGKSFSFNAANSQHIDVADIPAISFASGFTATAWVNFGTAGYFERIVDLGNGQGNSNIIFGRHGTDNELFVDVWDGTTQLGYCRAPNSIQSGWAHYAVTISGSTCTFYVNGSAVSGTNYLSINNPISVARTSNFIGRSNWGSDAFFESGIGRVSLWNRALNSSEIATRATAETPAAEVVLSTNAISVARGSAITSLTSTVYGGSATSFSISPTIPSGLSFNTTNGTLSGTPSVGLSSTTFTITANGVTGTPSTTFTLAISATALTGASAPTVSAVSGSSTSITVSFTSISNASSHTVRVYQSDGTTLVSTSPNFTSGGNVTGLTAGTAYKVSVQAIGDGTSYSTSAESSKSSVTTNISLTNGSIAFSGTNYIWAPASSDFNFGTGDFTVEWWQKFDRTNSGGAPRPWSIGVYSNSRLQVSLEAGRAYVGIGTSWVLSPSIPSAQYQNVWSHWALVRSSGTATLYLNGVSIASASNSTNLDLSALKLFVGTEDPAAYSTTKFAGNITEFRIVKSAVYTSNFTPPLGVSNITNTIVLLNAKQEQFLTDSSSIGRTFTNESSSSSSTAYPLPPTITSLSTTSGSTAGGTAVTISGTNLGSVTSITFGGTAGTSITNNTSTSVTITTPAKSAGSVDLIVTTAGGSVVSAGAFTFASTPTISSISASSGTSAGGTTVTITGTNLSGVSGITFGGTSGTSITNNTSTSVTVTTPAVAAGAVNVVLTTASGSVTSTNGFTFIDPPSISSASISGTTTSGSTLTASASGVGGGSGTTSYQWQSSTSSGGTYSNISGATSNTYVLPFEVAGKFVRVVITVTNSAGTASATSSATARISNTAYIDLVPSNYSSGSSWSSLSGTTSTGVSLKNSPTYTAASGSSSGYFSFVGSSQQWMTDATGATNPTSFTIAIWFKANSGATGKLIGFEDNQNTAGGTYDRMLYIGSDGKLRGGIWSTSAHVQTSTNAVNDGNWHFAVMTYASGSLNMYVDGVSQGSAVSGTPYNFSGFWKIGGTVAAGAWPSTGANYFTGDIGRVTVYSSEKSSSDVTTMFNSDALAFANAAPTIGGASISGTSTVGQTLTANTSTLGGGTITSTTYQWKISSDGTTFTNISGATSSTYTIVSGDLNKYIRVTITVSNAGGSANATSSSTNAVASAVQAPTLTGAAISGTTTQGQVLTASVQGASGGTATTTTYQWSRADSSGGTYSNISGATTSTYTLTSADVSKYIKVTIGVSNPAGGPNSATSNATSAIAIIAPTIASASFSGTTTTGQTLTASAGSLGGGAVSTTTYQWKSATTAAGVYSDISGATGSTYVLTSNEAGKYIKVTITVGNTAGSASATSNASAAAVISNSPTPTISSISPNAGTTAGGTSVTISGTNLSTVTDVTFDGSAATISTKTSTQLVVSTPAHSAGAVNVVVTNTAGSVTSTNGFTYATTPTTRSWTATPSITTGTNGDPFSVTYQAVCTTPQRYGPSMYDLIYVNGGSWAYNSYMGSGTSSDGGYTWTITKNYTITSNGIWKVDAYMRGACWDSYNFTYSTRQFINVGVAGPTITSLSVTSGPTSGGTATVVTGTNLTGVTAITVGGTSATSIRSNTSTSVTFNTPAGTAGAKNVVITTSAGSVTSTGGFTYVAPITITYDVNGGTGSPSRTSDSYTPNSGGYSLPVIGTMANTGYTFGGWATANNSNTAITSPYNPTSSLTVYAIWTAKNYTTSYISNGADSGTAPSNASNAFGTTVTVAGNSGSLAKAGFTLAGWDTAADGSGASYNLGSGTFTQTASNVTLYAEWVPITYTVSYDVNGSSDSAPTSHTGQLRNSTVTLAAGVTKASFAFVGWESGGVTYKAGASFTLGTSDATMVAKWIAVYKLSYNLNGTGATGSVPADFQYASGDTVTVTSVVPVRAGYTFGGWIDQSGGTHATSSTYAISGTNYLLYAVWTPIAYTVTYAVNGGQSTAPTQASKNVNDSFVVAAAATKTGSTFAGWSDGTTVYGAGSSYLVGTSNITLTAQWTANSYAITYDLAQGTSSVPNAVSKAYQASWNLPDAPTRVGYNFSDWYDGTNGYAASASYTLSTASDLTITARWTAIVYYTVTYDLDGGLGTAPTQDPLQNGQSFTLPADPAKTGNSFAGWSYAGTTYSSTQTITMPAANVTVTALWTATSAGTYAVTYISNGSQTSAPTTPPLAQNATFTVDDGSGLIKNGYIFAGWTYGGNTYTGGETITMPAASVTLSAVWVPSVRATAVTHSVDSTSITKGRSITVTYNVGCYAYSSTIPTITENVSTTGESFINDITSSLTVIDAGYNWTVTRVYTLSYAGTYTIFATVSGGCFSTSTDSTSSTVTVTEAPSSGGSSGGTTSGSTSPTTTVATAPVRTGSVSPVTVVGAKIALVANKNYTLPKLNPTTTLSVEAKTGSSTSSTSTSTSQSTGVISTTTTMLSVNSASKGLSEVKIVENQIAVVPTVGFSGKTEVSVTVTDGATTTTVTVPVTVLPEPVKDPTLTPVASNKTTVTWEASPNADSYQVIVDGKTACKAATDSCDVKKILGPNADVQVIANGGDATKSDAVDADYSATDSVVVTKLVGTTTGGKLTANDINMLNKVIATVKSQGFETVTISQITTNKVNSAAAKARVEALVNYVKTKSGDPDLVVKVVPAPAKTSMNQIGVK